MLTALFTFSDPDLIAIAQITVGIKSWVPNEQDQVEKLNSHQVMQSIFWERCTSYS